MVLIDHAPAEFMHAAEGRHDDVDAQAKHAADLARRLPTPGQEVFMLLRWESFTPTEVGQLLEIPGGAFRSRYARARAALRKNLEQAE